MNTTITKDQMILHDGEVYVTGYGVSSPYSYYYNTELKTFQQYRCEYGENKLVLCTTNPNLTTVTQIKREWFVRGEYIDANEEFVKLKGYSEEQFDNEEWSELYWFGAGITTAKNAKKGEFTREEMELAFNKGLTSVLRSDTRDYTFNKFMNELPPISLPNSLTLNKDNEIVKIEW